MNVRSPAIFLLIALPISVAGCGGNGSGEAESNLAVTEKAAATLEEEFQRMEAARKAFDDAESKVAVSRKFLDRYPSTDKTPRTLAIIFDYQTEELGDVPGAVAYAESLRSRIDDPAIALRVDRVMLDIYGRAREFDRMLTVASRLSAGGGLRFVDHWTIITNSIEAENWDLALNYCSRALPLATAETFRADYPDGEFTDDEVEAAARNREGMLLVNRGWAVANLGRLDEALADFREADLKVRRTFFDTPEYGLNVYWGEALLKNRDYETAMEKYAVDGLIMHDERALNGFERSYEALHGGRSGYASFAAQKRREIARPAEDFELSDYKGNLHRFSTLRGKVTLLTFWFPT